MAKKTLKKQTVAKSKGGRPSIYTLELSDRICALVAAGKAVARIADIEGMPSERAIHEWIDQDRDGFKQRYARALRQAADRWAAELLEIADQVPPTTETGATDAGWVQHQRVQIDARKWLMAKNHAQKYGDKVSAEITGANGGPVQMQSMTDEQLNALVQTKLDECKKRGLL